MSSMQTSFLMQRLATVLSILLPLFLTLTAAGPTINVGLKTSFSAAPYLVELIETAALENSTSYFPLLDRIADGAFADLQTEKELYNRFIEVLQEDGHIRNPESLSSFKYALVLHAAAPRVEAHFQYYNSTVQPHLMVAQDAVCPVWVYLDGNQYCSPALERAQQSVSLEDDDDLLPFDRVLGEHNGVPNSVLYADITHPLFGQFHKVIGKTALEGKTTYRVRYRPSSTDSERPLFVNGYGVELVLKRTDYIVIDDREAVKDDAIKQASLEQLDEDEAADLKPLTTSELATLGVNAASFIMSSSDPLDTLIQVSSNFPRYSSLLAIRNASSDFVAEHRANREKLLPSGFNVLWINGLQIENRQLNAYSLLDHLRRERRIIEGVQELGLSASQAIDLLSHEALTQVHAEDTPDRFDWRDEENGGNVILWLNDMEKDKRYATWPSNLKAIFQRTYPGQLPPIARDIHNLVVSIDLDDIEDIELVTTTLQGLVKKMVPIRVGVVPGGKSDTAKQLARLSYHLADVYGLSALLAFYQNIAQSKAIPTNSQKVFQTSIKGRPARDPEKVCGFEEIIKHENLSQRLSNVDAFQSRLDLQGLKPPALLNGVPLARNDHFFEALSNRVYADFQLVQSAAYHEAIHESSWIPDLFLFQASPRRNALVIPSDPKDIDILDVSSIVKDHSSVFDKLPRLAASGAGALDGRIHLLIISDFDTTEGQRLLSQVLTFHEKYTEIEISLLHHSSAETQETSVSLEIFKLVQSEGPSISANAVARILEQAKDSNTPPTDRDDSAFRQAAAKLASALGLESHQSGIWLNGRVIKTTDSSFDAEDLTSLLLFERRHRITPAATAITSLGLEDLFQHPLDLAKFTSLVARSLISDLPEGMRESGPLIRMNSFKVWEGNHTLIHVPAAGEAKIQLVAVLDPASEFAQILGPIVQTLSKLEGVDVKVYLNPRDKLSELPVKRFYRQVITAAPEFDDAGSLMMPNASFTHVPQEILFNLGMVVPPSWLVAPKDSIYDLDNIKLSSLGPEQNIDATYELEHILIEGHARDLSKGPPPRGVQLLLGSQQDPHYTDTIIMANLGYFQFKANPGYWKISLKPGRSSKIFNIDSIGPMGYYAQPGDETTSTALLSFQGVTLFPRLSRLPGMEAEDVLESSTGPLDFLSKGSSFAAFASSALSSLGFKKTTSTNADINIFSVASGHLYERMLNIMMVSVMKHTKSSVKFWFIEQFLSPSFKSTLPYLSEHYGFEYEMVTYKWPHWLRGQKEKQREIWGYKILFLDVLFPLDLDKVIFVDADQIVRTDMMELNKVDLQGAPYGFTPMCDSRTEMEGFRFWKTGYWHSYLRGKPYHISALYVVDLKRFRELAAGDRLRQQYQALSSDPNSLSNLDQDLPNNMQHTLPIFSLPQEWLWCETWCNDESLTKAKTIDLCNNPLTKEPKLARARRQVPEWTIYDEEIASVIDTAQRTLMEASEGGSSIELDQPVVQKVIANESKKDEL